MPILTTITPFWGREATLRSMTQSLLTGAYPGVKHLIIFVGELMPAWFSQITHDTDIVAEHVSDTPGDKSIAYYHDMGARLASSEWMMKLDADALPNPKFFSSLLPILVKAREREWFNAGMIYISAASSRVNLGGSFTMDTYWRIIHNRRVHCVPAYEHPQASNFICRREEYLELGGSDPRFRGWGWEDYQQMYMLEKNFLGRDPLENHIVHLGNVSQLCRDLIGRPKALELFNRDQSLCLLHKHHTVNKDSRYRAHAADNKEILLDYIWKNRK